MRDFKETCIWMSYRYAINRKASADKNFVWRLREVAASEKFDEDKGAELLRMIEEFAAEDYKTSN